MSKRFILITICFLGGCSIPFLDRAEKKTMCEIQAIQDVKQLFPTTVKEIDRRIESLKKDIIEEVQKICALPADQRTFQNTPQAIDHLSLSISRVMGPLAALKHVSPDKDVRENAFKKLIEMTPFMQEEVSKNRALFEAFRAYVEGNYKKEKLNEEERYFVDETMFGYKKEGMFLPQVELEHVKKLVNELAIIGQEFGKNINNDMSTFMATVEDLDGVPGDTLESLKKDDQGRFIVGVDTPTFVAVMKHAKKEETRKKMSRVYLKRAYPQNVALLEQLIGKRDELAKALGFDSYAAYDIDHKMAATPERVEKFLDELLVKALVKVDKEYELFSHELPSEVTLTDKGEFKPWDVTYVIEKYKQKHYGLDDSKIAEYFPVDHVVREVLNIYQEFLGLHFKEVPCEVWDPSVKSLEVYDSNNTLRGYLLLDLYPRPFKYSHACMMDIIPAYRDGETLCPGVVAVIANFPRGSASKPGLLTYNDVLTFFHEFGHAMHGLLGATEMVSFSGANVKWDFVEVPSQMFEEWLKDEIILKRIGRHYGSGLSLPEEMIKKLIEAGKLDAGFFNARQIGLSLASLRFYQGPQKNIEALYKDIMVHARPYILFDDEAHMVASWGHLTGYGALYYSYLWSKVYSMDLFDTIEKQGLLNPETGRQLVKKVLGRGGSIDPNYLVRDFLGRESNQDAFLRRTGLK